MRKAFKYRIYPAKAHISILEHWLDICRELHNAAIEERREAWKHGASIRFKDQSASLPAIKRIRTDVGEVYSQVLQQVLHRVDLAFKAFFRRVKAEEKPGFPRFKSRDRYNSVTWPQDLGFRLNGNRLHLSGIGEIKVKLHRAIEGRPKTVTVKREAGHWYAVFSCDDVPGRPYPSATNEVGLDMGLEYFATLSTGEKIENPRWYRKTEKRIADAQRNLSKKERRSGNYYKQKKRLARLHTKAANQRRDFQHKLSKCIVSENRLIAVEDLAPKKMVEDASTGMAKSINDAAWAEFLAILSGKAEEAGRILVRVPPKGTSSTCFRCGMYRKKNLSEREHRCPCGLVLDRDFHAALNILRLGRSLQVAS